MNFRKICIVFSLLLFINLVAFGQNVVVVLDFETASLELEDRMPMMTDIFRGELSKDSSIQIVDRKNTTDTLNELSFQITGMTSANNVKSIGQMLNADYVVIGQVDQIMDDAKTHTEYVEKEIEEGAGLWGTISGQTRTRTEILEKEVTVQNSSIIVLVQMIDVETSAVIATGQINIENWTDFSAHAAKLAKPLFDKMVMQITIGNATKESFIGGWEGEIVHKGIVDFYTFKFLENYRCEVTIESTNRQGKSQQVTARGRYTFRDNIFTVTVNMPNDKISHIQEIKWKTMVNMADDEGMFSAIVPTSSRSGSNVRADFYKLEF